MQKSLVWVTVGISAFARRFCDSAAGKALVRSFKRGSEGALLCYFVSPTFKRLLIFIQLALSYLLLPTWLLRSLPSLRS